MSIATAEEKKKFQTNHEKQKAPKKKKKGWIIALIVILLIIALPIAFLYIFIFDGTSPQVYEKKDLETTIRQKSVLALDEKRENKDAIDLSFNKDDLSSLLQSATESVPSEMKKYLNGLDVSIKGNEYRFNMYVKNLPVGFKTKVSLVTTLKEEAESYVFSMTDVKLGKIGFGSSALKLASKYLDDASLEAAFANSGLHMSCSLKEGKIVYSKESVKEDASSMLLGSEASLFGDLINEFLALDLLGLGSKNEALTFSLDLSSIGDNPLYVTPESEIALSEDLPSYRNKVETLLNLPSSPFLLEGDNDSKLMTFLIQGYSKASEEIRNYVRDKDMSAIGIDNPSLYEGKKYVSESSSLESILETKKDSLLTDGIKVQENELNALFQSKGILGESVLLSASFEEGYKSSYVTFDNLYANIFDDKISFVLGLNIGGKEIPAILNFNAIEGSHMLDLQKDKFFLGEKEISENLSKTLMDMLASSLEAESWIQIDKETMTIAIEGLSSPLPGIEMKANLKGNSLQDNGYILFSKKITL